MLVGITLLLAMIMIRNDVMMMMMMMMIERMRGVEASIVDRRYRLLKWKVTNNDMIWYDMMKNFSLYRDYMVMKEKIGFEMLTIHSSSSCANYIQRLQNFTFKKHRECEVFNKTRRGKRLKWWVNKDENYDQMEDDDDDDQSITLYQSTNKRQARRVLYTRVAFAAPN